MLSKEKEVHLRSLSESWCWVKGTGREGPPALHSHKKETTNCLEPGKGGITCKGAWKNFLEWWTFPFCILNAVEFTQAYTFVRTHHSGYFKWVCFIVYKLPLGGGEKGNLVRSLHRCVLSPKTNTPEKVPKVQGVPSFTIVLPQPHKSKAILLTEKYFRTYWELGSAAV